mgnify:CR=1 FL=1
MGKKDLGNQIQATEQKDLIQDGRKSAFSFTQAPKREFHLPNFCNCQPCQQKSVAAFPGVVSQTGMAALNDPRTFIPLQTVTAVNVPGPVYLSKGNSMLFIISKNY